MADATRREIAALLLSVFLIMFGGGFLSTFVSLRLSAAGVPSALIGAVGTAFFGALSLGSRRITPVIRRVGHIRAFATFASIFSISTLVYGVYIATVPWIALRCVDGAMMSGVLICIESWLNERATLANRGWLLAIYVALTYAGEGLGQMLLLTGSQDRFLPFVVASIALSLAIVPVALIPGSGPLPADHPHVRLRRLIRLSPLGVLGTGGNGLVMGAFYALTAVYLHAIGLSHFRVALFMAVVILGGSLIQWFVGYMSDRCDRREVIVWTSFAAALLAVVLPLVHHEASAFYLLAAGFGGAVFALYPLCVAHTNDRLSSEERVGASSALASTDREGNPAPLHHIEVNAGVRQHPIDLLDRMLGQPPARQSQAPADHADRQGGRLDHAKRRSRKRQHPFGVQVVPQQTIQKPPDLLKRHRRFSTRHPILQKPATTDRGNWNPDRQNKSDRQIRRKITHVRQSRFFRSTEPQPRDSFPPLVAVAI